MHKAGFNFRLFIWTNYINKNFSKYSQLKSPSKLRGLAWVMVVGMARFELATSWSQTRRDNRATLHPER